MSKEAAGRPSRGVRLRSEGANCLLLDEISSLMSGIEWRMFAKSWPTSESCSPTNAKAPQQSVNASGCGAQRRGRIGKGLAPGESKPISTVSQPKPNNVRTTNKPRRLGVRCKERLIRQPGGELIDIERLVEAGAQLLRIDEQADLGGLASEHPAETWV
jgi:hypothetical protein